MGREVRRVPANWEHPIDPNDPVGYDGNPRYTPLFYSDNVKDLIADWDAEEALWDDGAHPDQIAYPEDASKYWAYSQWAGKRPDPGDYMPNWPLEERTHYQMYENTSEGTPISPVMESPEELARWLTDTNASSFGSMTATYEQWLYVCKGGYACSMAVADGHIMSGVEALSKK